MAEERVRMEEVVEETATEAAMAITESTVEEMAKAVVEGRAITMAVGEGRAITKAAVEERVIGEARAEKPLTTRVGLTTRVVTVVVTVTEIRRCRQTWRPACAALEEAAATSTWQRLSALRE